MTVWSTTRIFFAAWKLSVSPDVFHARSKTRFIRGAGCGLLRHWLFPPFWGLLGFVGVCWRLSLFLVLPLLCLALCVILALFLVVPLSPFSGGALCLLSLPLSFLPWPFLVCPSCPLPVVLLAFAWSGRRVSALLLLLFPCSAPVVGCAWVLGLSLLPSLFLFAVCALLVCPLVAWWCSVVSSAPSLAGRVLVGGGRGVSAASPAGLACAAFVRALLASGGVLSVGCSVGADLVALGVGASFAPASVSVSAVFSSSGVGGWSASAVAPVKAFAASGGSVSWLAGGPLSLPLVPRLFRRSLAALAGCSLAVFFAPGRGSLSVARAALRAGVPVLVACAGCPVAPVLAVPAVLVVVAGLRFWLFAAVPQPALF